MSNHTAHGSQTFCTACDETGPVHKCCARHRELNLCAIRDGVEETNEVRFVWRKTGTCRGRSDFGYANRAAGECGEQQARCEVPMPLKLEEALHRFVSHLSGGS